MTTASYCVRLTRAAHDRVVFMLSSEERVALASVRHSTARVPFTAGKNRHGSPRLRRNPDFPLVTPAAATALEALARAAQLAHVDEATVDAFLLDGEGG